MSRYRYWLPSKGRPLSDISTAQSAPDDAPPRQAAEADSLA